MVGVVDDLVTQYSGLSAWLEELGGKCGSCKE